MNAFPKRLRAAAGPGIVLMEVLVAILIFSLAALGLMKVLTTSAKIAIISQLELRMLLRMQSILNEYSKIPQIQEGQWSIPADELGVSARVDVTKIEDLENSEQQVLADMYRVTVIAYYDNFGEKGEMMAETLRYARLYQTTGGATGGAPGTATGGQPPAAR